MSKNEVSEWNRAIVWKYIGVIDHKDIFLRILESVSLTATTMFSSLCFRYRYRNQLDDRMNY